MKFDRLAPYVYPLFRIVFGVMFVCHGLQKLGLFNGHLVAMTSRYGAAAIIETVCGTFIAVGFLTHLAAFVASGEMAVAYFLAHHPRGLWPITNGGEPAVLYCLAFLYIAARGAGGFSIDRR
jgi:putative oxidoreductase